MPASEESYGAGHPATFDETDPVNPNFDPVRAENFRREREKKIGEHLGQLSGEAFGDDMESFIIPGGTQAKFDSNDERE